jgi:hypothetical protein
VPTFGRGAAFLNDYELLSPTQRAEFKLAVRKFVEDLRRG